jgi:cobyrinic acid a,c-diamide synthase
MTESPVFWSPTQRGQRFSGADAGRVIYSLSRPGSPGDTERCSAVLRRLKGLIEQLTTCRTRYLPERADLAVSSRHLGLISPEELEDRRSFADRVADQLEKTVDLDAIEQIARSAPELKAAEDDAFYAHGLKKKAREQVRIAYAADEAFSFTYAENEELLQELGAELVPFSPLHDTKLPDNIGGMILCGGYPELYRRELAENRSMLEAVKEALLKNLPTIAECGGFMYLMREMEGKDKEKIGRAHV